MTDIHHSYTATEAPRQLGVNTNLLKKINVDIRNMTTSTLPSMESIFVEAQEGVENILRTAVYPRFVKYQMTNSASKALSSDRGKYQGLGDCFCLTDPAYIHIQTEARRVADKLVAKPTTPSCMLRMDSSA